MEKLDYLLVSFVLRLRYSMRWRIGGGTRFHGKIRMRSFGGQLSCGKNCIFGHSLFIDSSKGANIKIGNNVSINGGCYISAKQSISIGDNTRIGEYCSIRDNDHTYDAIHVPIYLQKRYSKSVTIGENVWIGRNVTIKPGVSIGNNVIIGANTFVNGDLEENHIYFGTPAKKYRRLG